MEYKEYTGKTVSDAITEACQALCVTSDRLDYRVIEEGSSGFLGIGSKLAKIEAREKEEAPAAEVSSAANASTASNGATVSSEAVGDIEQAAKKFLTDVFHSMNYAVSIKTSFDEAENTLSVDLSGEDMGVMIGKRGQTLDSLQYLVSLVVNKGTNEYIRVKVDTENYRERRKETLENLAKNISFKVKRTKRSVSLEPMNPYERRIIHSALQNDKYVTTHSEGEEPYRRVVVTLKKF